MQIHIGSSLRSKIKDMREEEEKEEEVMDG